MKRIESMRDNHAKSPLALPKANTFKSGSPTRSNGDSVAQEVTSVRAVAGKQPVLSRKQSKTKKKLTKTKATASAVALGIDTPETSANHDGAVSDGEENEGVEGGTSKGGGSRYAGRAGSYSSDEDGQDDESIVDRAKQLRDEVVRQSDPGMTKQLKEHEEDHRKHKKTAVDVQGEEGVGTEVESAVESGKDGGANTAPMASVDIPARLRSGPDSGSGSGVDSGSGSGPDTGSGDHASNSEDTVMETPASSLPSNSAQMLSPSVRIPPDSNAASNSSEGEGEGAVSETPALPKDKESNAAAPVDEDGSAVAVNDASMLSGSSSSSSASGSGSSSGSDSGASSESEDVGAEERLPKASPQRVEGTESGTPDAAMMPPAPRSSKESGKSDAGSELSISDDDSDDE